jgi:hypothetical protein
MARLIASASVDEVNTYRYNIAFCKPASSVHISPAVLPIEVKIPFFENVVKVVFEFVDAILDFHNHSYSYLYVTEKERKILETIFGCRLRNVIAATQKNLNLLEKMYTILKRKNEYVDVMYLFASIREQRSKRDGKVMEVIFNEHVTNRIGLREEDSIVEFCDITTYELQMRGADKLVYSINNVNIYMEPVIVSGDFIIVDFFVRIPVKISDLVRIPFEKSVGGLVKFEKPKSIGKFTFCIENQTWSIPLTEININEVLSGKIKKLEVNHVHYSYPSKNEKGKKIRKILRKFFLLPPLR